MPHALELRLGDAQQLGRHLHGHRVAEVVERDQHVLARLPLLLAQRRELHLCTHARSARAMRT